MKETNQGILLFTNLLDQIADVKSELIKPEDFAERSHQAYQTLIKALDGGLKNQLELLLGRVTEIISVHSEISVKLEISPYRASLAMFISTQLVEALALIHPENMLKYKK